MSGVGLWLSGGFYLTDIESERAWSKLKPTLSKVEAS